MEHSKEARHRMMIIFLITLIVTLVIATRQMMGLTEKETVQTKEETVQADREILEVRIRPGFKLFKMAEGLGVTQSHLIKINAIKNPDLIYAGNMLSVIPYTHTNKTEVSWYGEYFHGKLMANGKPFNMNDPTTVAHKYLPFGTKVRLIYNGKSIVVIVRDRGPYVEGRHFDLSKSAAEKLGFKKKGHVICKVEIID